MNFPVKVWVRLFRDLVYTKPVIEDIMSHLEDDSICDRFSAYCKKKICFT